MEKYSRRQLFPFPLRRELRLESKRETGSAMAQRIYEAIDERSFVGSIVFGSQRIGKSAYGLRVLYEIYEDWDDILDNYVLFDLDDVLRLLERSVNEREQIKAFMWDDAGVHASKHIFFSDRKKAQLLQNLFDVIGLYLGGVILTTPSPTNLLKALRDYEFYRIKVTRKNEYWGRNALGYRNILLPSGASYIKKVFQDSFNCHLPDDVYQRYEDMRSDYTKKSVQRLKDYLKSV